MTAPDTAAPLVVLAAVILETRGVGFGLEEAEDRDRTRPRFLRREMCTLDEK